MRVPVRLERAASIIDFTVRFATFLPSLSSRSPPPRVLIVYVLQLTSAVNPAADPASGMKRSDEGDECGRRRRRAMRVFRGAITRRDASRR